MYNCVAQVNIIKHTCTCTRTRTCTCTTVDINMNANRMIIIWAKYRLMPVAGLYKDTAMADTACLWEGAL